MLILQMRRATATVSEEQVRAFGKLYDAIPKSFRPLIRPTFSCQAQILGVPEETLQRGAPTLESPYESGDVAQTGEIFTDGTSLLVLCVMEENARKAPRVLGHSAPANWPRASALRLWLDYLGPELDPLALQMFEKAVTAVFGVNLEPWYYSNKRFRELKAEGRASPSPPSEEELVGIKILQDGPRGFWPPRSRHRGACSSGIYPSNCRPRREVVSRKSKAHSSQQA